MRKKDGATSRPVTYVRHTTETTSRNIETCATLLFGVSRKLRPGTFGNRCRCPGIHPYQEAKAPPERRPSVTLGLGNDPVCPGTKPRDPGVGPHGHHGPGGQLEGAPDSLVGPTGAIPAGNRLYDGLLGFPFQIVAARPVTDHDDLLTGDKGATHHEGARQRQHQEHDRERDTGFHGGFRRPMTATEESESTRATTRSPATRLGSAGTGSSAPDGSRYSNRRPVAGLGLYAANGPATG